MREREDTQAQTCVAGGAGSVAFQSVIVVVVVVVSWSSGPRARSIVYLAPAQPYYQGPMNSPPVTTAHGRGSPEPSSVSHWTAAWRGVAIMEHECDLPACCAQNTIRAGSAARCHMRPRAAVPVHTSAKHVWM